MFGIILVVAILFTIGITALWVVLSKKGISFRMVNAKKPIEYHSPEYPYGYIDIDKLKEHWLKIVSEEQEFGESYKWGALYDRDAFIRYLEHNYEVLDPVFNKEHGGLGIESYILWRKGESFAMYYKSVLYDEEDTLDGKPVWVIDTPYFVWPKNPKNISLSEIYIALDNMEVEIRNITNLAENQALYHEFDKENEIFRKVITEKWLNTPKGSDPKGLNVNYPLLLLRNDEYDYKKPMRGTGVLRLIENRAVVSMGESGTGSTGFIFSGVTGTGKTRLSRYIVGYLSKSPNIKVYKMDAGLLLDIADMGSTIYQLLAKENEKLKEAGKPIPLRIIYVDEIKPALMAPDAYMSVCGGDIGDELNLMVFGTVKYRSHQDYIEQIDDGIQRYGRTTLIECPPFQNQTLDKRMQFLYQELEVDNVYTVDSKKFRELKKRGRVTLAELYNGIRVLKKAAS